MNGSGRLLVAITCTLLLIAAAPVTAGTRNDLAPQGPETQPSQTSWKTVSRDGVTVRYSGSSDLLARQVLEKATLFLDETSVFFGVEANGPYDIVIADSRERFVELQPTSRPAPEWAGALTYPGLGLVLIMTPGATEASGSRYWSLLRHEMAHLVLGEAESANHTRLPRWFQEGLATYVAGEMTLPRLFHLGWAQVSGTAPTFAELEFSFPEQPALAEAAYARSYLFIRFLTKEYGDDSIAQLLESSLELGGIRAGARATFGLSLAQIMQEFDRYAKFRATWLPAISSTASLWGFITLLFLFSTYRKKVATSRKLQQWDEEEMVWETGPEIDMGSETEDPEEDKYEDEQKPTLH